MVSVHLQSRKRVVIVSEDSFAFLEEASAGTISSNVCQSTTAILFVTEFHAILKTVDAFRV